GDTIDLRICNGGRVMYILDGDRLAWKHARAPAEPWRQGDFRFTLFQKRCTNEVVKCAVEIAPPIKQRLRVTDNTREFFGVGCARFGNGNSHFSVRFDDIGKKRNQLVAKASHRPVLNVEIETGHELPVATRRDQQRVTDLDRFGQRIVRVAGEDDIDAGNPFRKLAVDIETIV